MNNPFTPAGWGREYDLAGAVWKPDADNIDNYGMVAVQTHMHRLARLGDNRMEGEPILPSPDWINAQGNPRVVAIAALERAGFRRIYFIETLQKLQAVFVYPKGDAEYAHVAIYTHLLGLPDNDWRYNLTVTTNDPALARYAVDCFTALHEWAKQINWDAGDD